MCIRDSCCTARRKRHRAKRGASCAGTAAPSGWILGPELILTSHQSDRLRLPTCEPRPVDICQA
eukprot:6148836-Alexandrium_andersonii.AAC.1